MNLHMHLPRMGTFAFHQAYLYQRVKLFSKGPYVDHSLERVLWIPGLRLGLISMDLKNSWKPLDLESLSLEEITFYDNIQKQVIFALPKDPDKLMGDRIRINLLDTFVLPPSNFNAMQQLLVEKEGLLAEKAKVDGQLCLKEKQLEKVVTDLYIE